MAAPLLTEMPSSLTAGTTVTYTRSHADYPANGGWTLTLYVAGVGLLAPITGTPLGTGFVVTLSATATAELPSGTYQWEERVTDGSAVYVAASGTVSVHRNIALAGDKDMQSHAERTLAIIEAALEGRLPDGMESYTIAGRAVTKIPLTELVELRARYRSEVEALRTPTRFGIPVLTTFTQTGFDR